MWTHRQHVGLAVCISVASLNGSATGIARVIASHFDPQGYCIPFLWLNHLAYWRLASSLPKDNFMELTLWSPWMNFRAWDTMSLSMSTLWIAPSLPVILKVPSSWIDVKNWCTFCVFWIGLSQKNSWSLVKKKILMYSSLICIWYTIDGIFMTIVVMVSSSLNFSLST